MSDDIRKRKKSRTADLKMGVWYDPETSEGSVSGRQLMMCSSSKSAPLERHLKKVSWAEIPMSFAEIEQIISDKLPASARRHRPWWSNNPSNSVITKAWLNAGYKTAQVDMEAEQLVFLKTADVPLSPDLIAGGPESVPASRHPMFGCMKETVTIAEGVDLTQPAMPQWAEMIDNPKLYNE